MQHYSVLFKQLTLVNGLCARHLDAKKRPHDLKYDIQKKRYNHSHYTSKHATRYNEHKFNSKQGGTVKCDNPTHQIVLLNQTFLHR